MTQKPRRGCLPSWTDQGSEMGRRKKKSREEREGADRKFKGQPRNKRWKILAWFRRHRDPQTAAVPLAESSEGTRVTLTFSIWRKVASAPSFFCSSSIPSFSIYCTPPSRLSCGGFGGTWQSDETPPSQAWRTAQDAGVLAC